MITLPPETKARAIKELRSALADATKDPDSFWPAMHAAEALTLAGQQAEVIAVVSKLVPQERDDQRRCGIARELVRAGQQSAVGVLFAILSDERSNGRAHAAESLYKIGKLRDGKALRVAFKQVENPRLQLMAAAAIARTGDHQALSKLRHALTSNDRELRKIGAWVLGLLGDKSDIAPLQSLLTNETDDLARAYIINALACLDVPEARGQLGKNLTSKEAPIRTYSAEFAGYSRSIEFLPQLVKLLHDENVDTRVRASQTLISFEQPRSAIKLKQVAFDE